MVNNEQGLLLFFLPFIIILPIGGYLAYHLEKLEERVRQLEKKND